MISKMAGEEGSGCSLLSSKEEVHDMSSVVKLSSSNKVGGTTVTLFSDILSYQTFYTTKINNKPNLMWKIRCK